MRSRQVTIEAKPGPLTIDLSKAAARVVDSQNDFRSKGGTFDRAGIDMTPIRATIAPTVRALAALRACGVPTIYVTMGYRPDLSDLGSPDSPNRERNLQFSVGGEVIAPNGQKSRIRVRDPWNTNAIDELKPEPGDLELYKTRFGGFHATELDAMFLDYSCVLLSDCAAEPVGSDLARTNHEASLLVIQVLFGCVSDSNALLRGLA